MPRPSKNDPTESGVLVYPKVPVPERARQSEPRLPRSRGSLTARTYVAIGAGGLLVGIVIGFLLRPMLKPDDRLDKLERAATEATLAATTQKDRADELDSKLKVAVAARTGLDKQLAASKLARTELVERAAEAEQAAKSVQSKLAQALDKGSGSVSADGEEIRLQLVDKVLFKVGDDQLTERGKLVLAKVGAALKDIPDKQIWVQGHTDDTPIYIAPAPKRPRKGAPPPAAPRFATNWELSAARALTVVHYLQDVAKLDPTKLAALAFGEYRPLPRKPKAANRRIEIVLYPHRAVIEK